MVTDRFTGALIGGSDRDGRSLISRLGRLAQMLVQMAGGTRGGIVVGALAGLAAAEFRGILIALPAGGVAGGGFARRPQVDDLL